MKKLLVMVMAVVACGSASASLKLDLQAECVGYLASMPADTDKSGAGFDNYERQYQKVYDLYREEMKGNGYTDVELGRDFATYWSVYGTSRPLLKMVDLARSTDQTAIQSAAVEMYNTRNCDTVLQ